MKTTKICLSSMFKNEAHCIESMLESVYPYIDFYIMQDNGSTDGTPDIVKSFFDSKKINGYIYNVKEGWISHGWNRDHLILETLNTPHNCDWILRVDSDETLQIDDNFDWSVFNDTRIDSFNVASTLPGLIYYRTWMWNAKRNWRFRHDPTHECIYLEGEVQENFQRLNLPTSFKMNGSFKGESYSCPTKYISDALKQEETLIREGRMISDMYHLWYVGKSYYDCYSNPSLPFGKKHMEEFAKRAIFYFENFLSQSYENNNFKIKEDECCYLAVNYIAHLYKYLGDINKCIFLLNESEVYSPERNEHIASLAEIYFQSENWEQMLKQTQRLVCKERVLPFPHKRVFLINSNLYHDSGEYPAYLHNIAVEKNNLNNKIESEDNKKINMSIFSINPNPTKRIFVLDNFYQDPYAVRDFALNQNFKSNLNFYKGERTEEQIIFDGTKEAFEKLIGQKIENWSDVYPMCGRFQSCTSEDSLVYHWDHQKWAAMIYLTPDAPYVGGTSMFSHKGTNIRHENDIGSEIVFEGGFYDRSKFELVDTIGNVFNRLVIFDSKTIHAANEYFGKDLRSSRLFHMFFFD